MKKSRFLSFALATLLVAQVSSPMVSYGLNFGEVLPQKDNAEALYTSEGSIVLHPYDIVKMVEEEQTFLTFADVHSNERIYEFDSLPSVEEAKEKFGDSFSVYCLINGETPSAVRYTVSKDNEVSITEAGFSAEVKWIMDMVKKEIRDYESDEVLQSLTKNTVYYLGAYSNRTYRPMYYMGRSIFITPTSTENVSHDSLFGTDDSFEPFKFIYELLDVVNAYLKDNKDLDWRTVGDKLNLDDPAKSKVEIIAGNEESAKAIESYIESQGYSKDLLEISVDPDFVIQPDILLPLIPDYNGDNVTDLTDLTALSLYLIGDAEWNDSQIINFDCNADGKTNIADLAHLKQYIMCEDVKLG